MQKFIFFWIQVKEKSFIVYFEYLTFAHSVHIWVFKILVNS